MGFVSVLDDVEGFALSAESIFWTLYNNVI
jgi:hypothetical protein